MTKLLLSYLLLILSLSSFATDLDEFHRDIIENQKGLIVKLNGKNPDGSYWCGPCKMFYEAIEQSPKFTTLQEDTNTSFVSIDYNRRFEQPTQFHRAYLDTFGNLGLPAIILLNQDGIKKIVNGEQIENQDYVIIKSRTFLELGYNDTVKSEVIKGALELGISTPE